jgi:hypothetical protein
MNSTYTQAQYSTPSQMAWILQQMGPGRDQRDIECMAAHLKSMKVGSIAVCRKLVIKAIQNG